MKTLALIFTFAMSSQALAVKVGDYVVTKNIYKDPSAVPTEKIETIKQTVLNITPLSTGETEYEFEQQMSMSTGESGASIQYMKIADPAQSVCPIPLFGGSPQKITVGTTELQTCLLAMPGGDVSMWLLPDFPGIAKMIVRKKLENGDIAETLSEIIEYHVTP